MSRVKVEVEYTTFDGDYTTAEGECVQVPGVTVTCSQCEHSVGCFGQSDASIKRACVMLREECPEGEKNFYVAE